ncbi:SDR family oxidoreductase [Mycobacterium sp. E2327]|uniref:SDR family oxidoreductase n=1 Tax=Mycobacterium sp. E2327 TaxID=1834132 RepID=UPI0009EE31B0|nr:NAD(P)H-binding protein [Mycobacterium sp. E2327]
MTIVVTGATGNVGRPLVAELLAAGAHVRAVTRTPDAAGLPAGVEAVRSAFDALPGASAVFLNSRALGPDLSRVVAECGRAGVTKLVALSAINADDDFSRQPSRFRGDRNKEVEQLAVESGLDWVSLRPSVFVTNFAGMWGAQIRAGDMVAGPYAAASTAPIVESDISAVAARALLTDDLVGQRIPLTGPQAFTNSELAAAIGDVLGRPLRYQEAPTEVVRRSGWARRLRTGLVGLQTVPQEFVALVHGLLECRTGTRPVSATGRRRTSARCVQTFARSAIARLRFGPPAAEHAGELGRRGPRRTWARSQQTWPNW